MDTRSAQGYGFGMANNMIPNKAQTPDPVLEALLPEVIEIARESGNILMRHFKRHRSGRPVAVQTKDDNSPVTIADHESSAYLVDALERLTPFYPVVSEENDFDPLKEGVEDFWAIDPLDGTKEFIAGSSGFSNKITLIRGGHPQLAVIYCPVQNVLFDTLENDKARKTDRSGTVKNMQTKYMYGSGKLVTLFNSKSGDLNLYREWRKALAQRDLTLPVRPKGKPGLPRNLRVAEGLADIYLSFGHSASKIKGAAWVWDIAGDDLILRNAGGGLVHLHNGKPPVYTNPREILPAYVGYGCHIIRYRMFGPV